jgi:tetratricopeptide (TPR) repeat protein
MTNDALTLMRELQMALTCRDQARVVAVVTRIMLADPPLGHHWRSIAAVAQHEGEVDAARLAMRRYVTVRGEDAHARFEEATLLAQTGAPVEAERIMATLPADVPNRPGNAFIRGTLAMNLGDANAARAHLVDAVTENPRAGQAWMALAALTRFAQDPAMAARLADAGAAFNNVPSGERAFYLYALGKMLDETGEIDRAFAAFSEGAAIVARERPYDPAADVRWAKAALAGWTTSRVAAVAKQVIVPTNRAIIVTGLPRSGTTLVEQILVSHSAVVGGEELGLFGRVAARHRGADAAFNADAIARDYLRLASQRVGANGRFVDKTLDASRTLGLLAAVLPDAPLIWVQRPVIDSAWSCFRTFFLRGVEWSWSMDAIARHFVLEEQLAARWQEVLGDRLLLLDYEALVSEPDVVIDSLAAHAGLAMEQAMLSPEKTVRAVVTASVMQVREPINRRGLGGAARYLKYLQPFMDTYHKFGGTRLS